MAARDQALVDARAEVARLSSSLQGAQDSKERLENDLAAAKVRQSRLTFLEQPRFA